MPDMPPADPFAPTVEELLDYENTIAGRIPDAFDMDTGQPAVIDRWLDLIEARMKTADPAGHAWLFLGGDDPRPEDTR